MFLSSTIQLNRVKQVKSIIALFKRYAIELVKSKLIA